MSKHGQEFGSLEAYLAYIEATSSPWRGGKSSRKEAEDFNGNVTYQQSLDLARKGWAEGRNSLTKEVGAMAGLTSIGSARALGYDVAGYLPEIPRAIVGLPDCMFMQGEDMVKAKPIIRILVCMSAVCYVSKLSILWRGAAILSYIDKLEDDGHSVELSVYHAEASLGKTIYAEMVVKRAGEPLELDRLAFVLLHPAFLRRIGFAYIETFPFEDSFRYGYGSPENYTASQLRNKNFTIHFPKIEDNYMHKSECLDYVRKTIEDSLTKSNEGEV